MTEKVFNIGVVGLGEHGWDNVLPSLAVLHNANIKAVCDIVPQRLQTAARSYGASAYHNFHDLIDSEPLDAVVVASHPDVHYAVLKTCLPKGLPVFVEKPPTLHTAELQQLIELNAIYKTVTAVGLNFNFTEPIRFLRALMAKPEFGHLEYVRICHFGNKPSEPLWGLDSLTRSFLLSQAIHPLGLMFDLGAPVMNKHTIDAHKSGAGFLFSLHMKLADQNHHIFTADVLTSSSAPYFEWQLQLISSNGVIVNVNSLWEVEVYSQNRRSQLIDNQKWWRDIWRPSPLSGGFKRNGYEHQFTAFLKNIETGAINSASLESMPRIYELIDEMEQACEQTQSSRKQVSQY